jgi:DNA (cytosine-5)-methyltransferase 1
LFCGGGGSSMGYKLAGYNVLGGVEIDTKQAELYKNNLHPKYFYNMDIREFNSLDNLPKELYELDILDGSPPCTLFSVANLKADSKKGKLVKHREGKVTQVLDDLFAHAINTVAKLNPKVVVFENVKGLLQKKNLPYLEEVYYKLGKLGYKVNHTLLDSSLMGVPQKRERVFIVANRLDITPPDLSILMQQKPIYFKEIYEKGVMQYPLPKITKFLWDNRIYGDNDLTGANGRIRNKPNTGFNNKYVYLHEVVTTLDTKKDSKILFDEPRYLNDTERIKIQTFPLDYNFLNQKTWYVIGMSVPPLMMKSIAKYLQYYFFDKEF